MTEFGVLSNKGINFFLWLEWRDREETWWEK